MRNTFRKRSLGEARLAATILTLGLALPALARAEEGLAGAWEGFIEERRRPIFLAVKLVKAEAGWTGTVEIPGAGSFPLQEIRFDAPQVSFVLALDPAPLNFAGTLDGEGISGTVTQGDETTPFSLRRPPTFPPPANRVEAWRQDLEVAEKKFLRYDRSFSPAAREAFRAAIAKLKVSLATMNDPQVIVALARAVALSDNAHTRLYLLRNRTELRRYPIRVYWFSEGLYVVKTRREHGDLLGARVLAIGVHEPEEVKRKVGELFAGNESWRTYKSTYFMTSPEILFGLGLIPDLESTEWSFEDATGKRVLRTLIPLPLEKKTTPTEAWWDLSPAREGESAWIHALADGNAPTQLYLRNPNQHYWFEYLVRERTLYLQYNRSQNMAAEAFSAFTERLLKFLDANPVDRFVVDLRFNTGGDLGIARPLWKALAERKDVNQPGALFVLSGRATFSAGISAAAQLKESTAAILVGEPVGDRLDMWSEGGNIVMPNSKLTLHFANGFHGYSTVDYPDRRPYFMDLNVPDLDPDVPVALSWRDYVARRDPALEACFSYGN